MRPSTMARTALGVIVAGFVAGGLITPGLNQLMIGALIVLAAAGFMLLIVFLLAAAVGDFD